VSNPLQPSSYNTARELIAGRYRLEIWCPRCRASRSVNLAEMVMRGRGDEPLIGRRWVCRDCGARGEAQLQPPVPGSPGYDPNNKPGGGV
jgi:transposase-like protein